jgi:TRAP-type C4-dicarboxylate transport system permease small subunit
MFERYVRAMDVLHRLCMVIAGLCLLIITLIIPWGVYSRYVLGYGSQWPEPIAIILMILFTFSAGAACYRENLHIAVMMVPDITSGIARTLLAWFIELCMLGTSLFLLFFGWGLVRTTWNQVMAQMPVIPVGLTYLPIPTGGLIIALFVIERLWSGRFFAPAEGEIPYQSPANDAS